MMHIWKSGDVIVVYSICIPHVRLRKQTFSSERRTAHEIVPNVQIPILSIHSRAAATIVYSQGSPILQEACNTSACQILRVNINDGRCVRSRAEENRKMAQRGIRDSSDPFNPIRRALDKRAR